MKEPTYEDEYRYMHLTRINHLISFLARYINTNSRIGIVGYSIFDSMIRDSFKNCNFYNIIPDTNFITDRNIPKNQIVVYDVTLKHNVEVNPRFDAIIFTEVLEHLFADDSLILNNISKLLDKEGLLLFSVPNVSAIGKLTDLVFGRNPYMVKTDILEGSFGGFGHIREYSFREVRNLLSGYFNIIELMGWNDYPNVFNRIAKFLPKIYAETIFALCQKL